MWKTCTPALSAIGNVTAMNTEKAAAEADLHIACQIVRDAAHVAAERFHDDRALNIERKGAQDWVSEVDRDIEVMIRASLADAFADDGIVGEEHAPVTGISGRTWVIDPIDGTSLYVTRSPGWVVTMAAVTAGDIVQAVTYDPLLDECFAARRGGGASLNGRPMQVQDANGLDDCTFFVGYSGRVPPDKTLRVLKDVLEAGGQYRQTGSGAAGLASVAAGRTAGYIESKMHAWDCLAGLLLIEEAGGRIMNFDMQSMLEQGGAVIAGALGIHEDLMAIANRSFNN